MEGFFFIIYTLSFIQSNVCLKGNWKEKLKLILKMEYSFKKEANVHCLNIIIYFNMM
jgi:hypothetical protein